MQGGHGYGRIHASHKCLSPAGCALLYAHAGPYEYSEYGTNRSLVKPRVFRDDDALLVQPPFARCRRPNEEGQHLELHRRADHLNGPASTCTCTS